MENNFEYVINNLDKDLISNENKSKAIKWLGSTEDKSYIPVLLDCLLNDNLMWYLRVDAAFSIAKLDNNIAVPYIIELIENNSGKNPIHKGSLLYILQDMECVEYFLLFINIICTDNFECRQMSEMLISKYVNDIDPKTKMDAWEILRQYRVLIEAEKYTDDAENRLSFIDDVDDLIHESNNLTIF